MSHRPRMRAPYRNVNLPDDLYDLPSNPGVSKEIEKYFYHRNMTMISVERQGAPNTFTKCIIIFCLLAARSEVYTNLLVRKRRHSYLYGNNEYITENGGPDSLLYKEWDGCQTHWVLEFHNLNAVLVTEKVGLEAAFVDR